MRHGMVTNGRTTTYYGDDAQRMMARMSAQYCTSQAEADEKVEKVTSVYVRKYLVEALERVGYKFDPAKLAEYNARDEKMEAEQKAAAIVRHKARHRENPVLTKTTSSKCNFCQKRITKGQQYHDGGKGQRAHVACAAE